MRPGPIAAALLVASLPLRLPNLGAPLLEGHGFRQTQTAISVSAMLDEGIRLFDYQTPILGPPWRVPFELPVYQISAALLATATRMPVDLACRVTSLLYFYASALLLYVLVRRCLGDGHALATLGVYAFSPFTIFWSRAALIEWSVVAFGLGAILAADAFRERPSPGAFVSAVALGALAWAVKLTTGPALLPPLVARLWPLARRERRRAATLALAAAIVVVPIACGYGWARYADGVRAASPYTRPLSTAELQSHLFGSLAERLGAASWKAIGDFVGRFVTPGLAIGLLPLGLSGLRRLPADGAAFVLSILAGLALPLLAFTHLYGRHDYYLCAIVPWLSVLAGAGLVALAGRIGARRWLWIPVVILLGGSMITARSYGDAMLGTHDDNPIVVAGRAVAALTSPGDLVVVADQSWSPALLYYAHRRGFMLYRFEGDECNAFLRAARFATVVSRQDHPKLFSAWGHRASVASVASFDVSFVGDDDRALEQRVAAVRARLAPLNEPR
ncbi:MAG: glycosyltransferase family 39 protein [Acidobacteriota bacterium]